MATNRRSIRRTVRSIEKGLRIFQREVGDQVLWYELDQADSGRSDTYGEGAIPDPFDASTHASSPVPASGETGLVFKAPKTLPAVWIRFMSPEQVQTDAGYYTIKHLSLRFSADSMRFAGLRSPEDPAIHMQGDRFDYNGALYRVEQYEPKGWVSGKFLMVDVAGRELKEEELESDQFPFWQSDDESTPWTPGQQLTWPATQPTDLENR